MAIPLHPSKVLRGGKKYKYVEGNKRRKRNDWKEKDTFGGTKPKFHFKRSFKNKDWTYVLTKIQTNFSIGLFMGMRLLLQLKKNSR